jgi:hypothetical protein
MKASSAEHSNEEIARIGEELFSAGIHSEVAGMPPEHFVAIDVESGDYEVNVDDGFAVDAVRKRHPGTQVWLRRVGSRHAHKLGGRFRPV